VVKDLMTSMVRLSAALTIFGMEQAQTAVDALSDSKASTEKFRKTIDALTDAVIAQVDERHRDSLKEMADAGAKFVDRSWSTVGDVDTGGMLDSATKVIRKTADALTEALEKESKGATGGEGTKP
jgi:DNA-directed RNA polymerase beta' subunit